MIRDAFKRNLLNLSYFMGSIGVPPFSNKKMFTKMIRIAWNDYLKQPTILNLFWRRLLVWISFKYDTESHFFSSNTYILIALFLKYLCILTFPHASTMIIFTLKRFQIVGLSVSFDPQFKSFLFTRFLIFVHST